MIFKDLGRLYKESFLSDPEIEQMVEECTEIASFLKNIK